MFRFLEPVSTRLSDPAPAGGHWLWCAECTRFFPLERLNQRQQCPFPDCHGMGLDFGILYWDTEREPADPRWPRSSAELRDGQRSPDMEAFYLQKFHERMEALIAGFLAWSRDSPRPIIPRYLRAFFELFRDLCWDLTENDPILGFNPQLAAELLEDLPVWAKTADTAEVPRMLGELQRFFEYAAEERVLSYADQWLELLTDDGLELPERLCYTMATDWRLKPRKPERDPDPLAARAAPRHGSDRRRGGRRRKRKKNKNKNRNRTRRRKRR